VQKYSDLCFGVENNLVFLDGNLGFNLFFLGVPLADPFLYALNLLPLL